MKRKRKGKKGMNREKGIVEVQIDSKVAKMVNI